MDLIQNGYKNICFNAKGLNQPKMDQLVSINPEMGEFDQF